MPRIVVPIASPLVHAVVQQPIFLEMPGENHVRPVADHQVPAHGDAAGGQSVDFVEQAGRIEHHAAGDDALHPGAEDAAGNQRELVLLAPRNHRVARVGAALVADDDVVLLGEKIDDLPLRFIPPLQTDYTSSRHAGSPSLGVLQRIIYERP